jgi:NAD(P)H-dependent flavin oxidoreductase YrpB (nitropropane dioxygenase family)
MKLPQLKIGKHVAQVPIVQGGMGVKISEAPLAAAVANNGGIGLIAASGLSADETVAEIRKARALAPTGVIGVNIMFVATDFVEIVTKILKEKIDIIFTGAGFSRDIFKMAAGTDTAIVPIVSSARLAALAKKFGAHAVCLEGKEAGGHLGTDRPMKAILPEIKQAIAEATKPGEEEIPIIAAGGILHGIDIVEAMELGASGVQMGSRFVLAEECTASYQYKMAYINAKPEDIVVTTSPVGLPGRAIRNKFIEQIEAKDTTIRPRRCTNCMKDCSHLYCILDRLIWAHSGDVENGLLFAGERTSEIKDILPVKTIIQNLIKEVSQIEPKESLLMPKLA